MTVSFESSRGLQLSDSNLQNGDLCSNYARFKEMFEEATTLTPQEQRYIQDNGLEDKLNAIKFDFWKQVNSIVNSYFGILRLLKAKKVIEEDIHKLWLSKLSVPVQDLASSSSTEAPRDTRNYTWLSEEEGVVRLRVGLAYCGELLSAVRRLVLGSKASSFRLLQREAKWFRAQRFLLANEIQRKEEQRRILHAKLNCPGKEWSSRLCKKRTHFIRNVFKGFWKFRQFEGNLILSKC